MFIAIVYFGKTVETPLNSVDGFLLSLRIYIYYYVFIYALGMNIRIGE
jgi:hypothetical protein